MNLPKTERYTISRTFHTGGLENACACDNCGRAIVEVAEIGDRQGNQFRVGMDCAQSLTVDFVSMNEAAAWFDTRKSFAAAVRKGRKLLPDGTISVHSYGPDEGFFRQGGFLVQFGPPGAPGSFSKNYPEQFLSAILPFCPTATPTVAATSLHL